jgi:hypothetical protein
MNFFCSNPSKIEFGYVKDDKNDSQSRHFKCWILLEVCNSRFKEWLSGQITYLYESL